MVLWSYSIFFRHDHTKIKFIRSVCMYVWVCFFFIYESVVIVVYNKNLYCFQDLRKNEMSDAQQVLWATALRIRRRRMSCLDLRATTTIPITPEHLGVSIFTIHSQHHSALMLCLNYHEWKLSTYFYYNKLYFLHRMLWLRTNHFEILVYFILLYLVIIVNDNILLLSVNELIGIF